MAFILPFFTLASTLTSASSLTACQAQNSIPFFVLDHAPVAYLYSTDPYRPADLQTHLNNTTPLSNNLCPIPEAPCPLTLSNLNTLNTLTNSTTYLTTPDAAVPNASWLRGTTPNAEGKTPNSTNTVIIVNDHHDGVIDAFYFYFYSFDWGGSYLGLNIGNHVGDWEHNMIRFDHGKPQAIWYSQHARGQAFEWAIVKKEGARPVVYVANGTHANYATPGRHAHAVPTFNLPDGVVADAADKGVYWDPLLSASAYSYDADGGIFEAYCGDDDPVGWLYYQGRWGDQQYPVGDDDDDDDDDGRQENYFGWLGVDLLWKFVDGPTGPGMKELERREVCPDNGVECVVWPFLKA